MSLEVHIEKRMGQFQLKVDFSTQEKNLGILGASGCGKSVTLQCIAGILKPDWGWIRMGDRVLFDSERHINLPPQKRQVGYLFQNYALFPNMTVTQNIACGIRNCKDKKERKHRVETMIQKMHLEGLENKKPKQLSGGQQQRTAMARILIGQPELIMFDEPFSALDSHLKDTLMTDVKEMLKDYGQQMILVTHNLSEAFYLCKEALILDHGQCGPLKSMKTLYDGPDSVVEAQLVGCKNIFPAEKVDDHKIRIQGTDQILETKSHVKDSVCAVAFHAHALSKQCRENVCHVQIEEVMELPEVWRIKGHTKEGLTLWYTMDQGRCDFKDSMELGIIPEKIYPLYS